MKRLTILLIVGVGMLFLSGCVAKSTPTSVPQEAQVTTTQAATSVPTQPVAVEPAKNTCLDCHTDKQRLIDTTAPEEESAEEESEGVG
ncbi:MAG: hypothetical protein CVU39_22050 [Chloroflexi bacterium HGW-Chloroflexi-10]|nr:MAG: hypothetical protein CVU39_22050 [Chloroflexi bacterium HGW-Chloroflexi-10]